MKELSTVKPARHLSKPYVVTLYTRQDEFLPYKAVLTCRASLKVVDQVDDVPPNEVGASMTNWYKLGYRFKVVNLITEPHLDKTKLNQIQRRLASLIDKLGMGTLVTSRSGVPHILIGGTGGISITWFKSRKHYKVFDNYATSRKQNIRIYSDELKLVSRVKEFATNNPIGIK